MAPNRSIKSLFPQSAIMGEVNVAANSRTAVHLYSDSRKQPPKPRTVGIPGRFTKLSMICLFLQRGAQQCAGKWE